VNIFLILGEKLNIHSYTQGYHRSRTKKKDDWGKFDYITWKENNCFCLQDQRQIMSLSTYLQEPFALAMSYFRLPSWNRHRKFLFRLLIFWNN